jgi:hypothetical protein
VCRHRAPADGEKRHYGGNQVDDALDGVRQERQAAGQNVGDATLRASRRERKNDRVSFDPNIGCLDGASPFLNFPLDEFLEMFRCNGRIGKILR